MIKRVYSLETEYALAYDEPAAKPLATRAKAELYARLEAELLSRGGYATCDPTRHQARQPARHHGAVDIQICEGYFLTNGARLYFDTGHLEWAAPEASDPYRALVYDRAGERELADAAAVVKKACLGNSHPLIVKNNLDYQSGVTYGCHENYSVRRLSTRGKNVIRQIVDRLVPFLVTRQILCGAGRLGAERPPYVAFQLSQRADFITDLASVETRERRPIVNTRDEPLADGQKYARLHLILGDSNMAEYSAVLKLGMTGILLDMVEADAELPNLFLLNPQEALHQVSRDLNFTCRLPLKDGSAESALGIQRAYLQSAWNFVYKQSAYDPLARLILQIWDGLLMAIEQGVAELAHSLDWAIKRRILGQSLQQAGATWQELEVWEPVLARTWNCALSQTRPALGWGRWLREKLPKRDWEAVETHVHQHKLDLEAYAYFRRIAADLRALDIRYHDINPERGLFYQPGQAANLIGHEIGDAQEVELARREAPKDTRAAVRAHIIHQAHTRGQNICMDWDRVHLGGIEPDILLPDPLSSDLAGLPPALSGNRSRPSAPQVQKEVFSDNKEWDGIDIDILGQDCLPDDETE